jgi:hypothetical protein
MHLAVYLNTDGTGFHTTTQKFLHVINHGKVL